MAHSGTCSTCDELLCVDMLPKSFDKEESICVHLR